MTSTAEPFRNIVAVLARIPVESIEVARPLYQRLAGTSEVRSFTFGAVHLAWIGPFLLLEGADAAVRARSATIIVRDVDAVLSTLRAAGGTILDGPMAGPNGRRVIARHPDGAVLEYIEQIGAAP
ncbi:VOC family protein [Curtobacterium sp. 9128]|uniref:VOC family protein n=1 Tax=Curtobacterium sp. 9128 TaxID=1793722 RepID=UPI00119EC536|nr:VOC family protein [Curtobacterium sp. 9128]